MPDTSLERFKHWFWQPPRPHGQTIADRRVSPLELLYDLIYVALIAQAAHHLAEDVSARTLFDFTVVTALIWLAWINGSLYLELHGQPDGRTRSYVFLQMGILALLAVFTESAAGSTGVPFALLYTGFLVVLTWLWYTVRRQDRPEFMAVTARYLAAMLVTIVAILASTALPPDARLLVWAVTAAAWFAFFLLLAWTPALGFGRGVIVSESMVERFGLFTIIVLGEVVFGVVAGLSVAEHDPVTMATGILALGLGFGFWWLYFDILGGRPPRQEGRALVTWMLCHFPIALAIAASGAAMVSLIEHAHDPAAPAPTAWLIGGAVAVALVAQPVASLALRDAPRLASVYRPLRAAMLLAAVGALIVAALRPPPWLLVLSLDVILSVLWFFAAARFLRAGAWRDESSPTIEGTATRGVTDDIGTGVPAERGA
jgi:low temperature requirement protein LtrA